MDKKEYYKDYIDTHYANINNNDLDGEREYFTQKITQSILELKTIGRDAKILDLGCGFGKFAEYCKKRGYYHYTGVDISTQEIELNKETFPMYKFVEADIFDFLDSTNDRFDLIFMSHTLEHFTREKGSILLKLIYEKLNVGGVFINIMPNAFSYFTATSARYTDITHETIYSPSSFSQSLAVNTSFRDIRHKNYYIGDTKLQHMLHKLVLKMFEYFLQALGYTKKEVYTSSMITVARK